MHAAGSEVDRRTHRVAWALGSTNQHETHPVIVIIAHVAQKHWSVIEAINHYIDFSVVEQIAEGSAARGNHVCQTRALDCRHHLEFLAMIEVVEQQRTFGK